MISAGLLLISFMLMVLNIYLDHGYEDEHHLDVIYIYYSLELEFNMNIMDGNAKCHHLKKLTCKGTLRQVLICLRPRTQYPLPYTLYTCIQYTYSCREGREGDGLNQREG